MHNYLKILMCCCFCVFVTSDRSSFLCMWADFLLLGYSFYRKGPIVSFSVFLYTFFPNCFFTHSFRSCVELSRWISTDLPMLRCTGSGSCLSLSCQILMHLQIYLNNRTSRQRSIRKCSFDEVGELKVKILN